MPPTELEVHGGWHGESQVEFCQKCFYGGLQMTLVELRDTKLWPVFQCITMSPHLKARANKLWLQS
jgi:hypothetical protein